MVYWGSFETRETKRTSNLLFLNCLFVYSHCLHNYTIFFRCLELESLISSYSNVSNAIFLSLNAFFYRKHGGTWQYCMIDVPKDNYVNHFEASRLLLISVLWPYLYNWLYKKQENWVASSVIFQYPVDNHLHFRMDSSQVGNLHNPFNFLMIGS